jgi:FeS assembly protein IscX
LILRRDKDMKWTDSLDIAIELTEQYPDVDPKTVRFTDLREWVMGLEDFDDEPERCGERILEAIQMYWIEEAD